MPRTFESETTFPYPFYKTALAVWNKYPNPHAAHVVSVDVLDQSVCARTGLLRTERILGVRQGAPKWATKLLGGAEDTFVREVVMVDPTTSKLEMTSTNLSLSQYLLVKEYIVYEPSQRGGPASSSTLPVPASAPAVDATDFRQKAHISCRGLSGMLAGAARKVEDWSFSRFGDNAARGRVGFMSVLEGMWGPPPSVSVSTGGSRL